MGQTTAGSKPTVRYGLLGVLLFLLLSAAGIALVWFTVKPKTHVTGYIRVAPAVHGILRREPLSTVDPNQYRSYMTTQAMSITSPAVLERVVDDLAGRKMAVFSKTKGGGPMDTLKRALAHGTIKASAIPDTELIAVSMLSDTPQEAVPIVDSFIRNYMAIYAYGSTREEEANLRLLENTRKELQDKIQQRNQQIRQLDQEYGSADLDSRQDMMALRVTGLVSELTRLESSRIGLEASLLVPGPEDPSLQAGQAMDPNAVSSSSALVARNQYINSDVMVQELTRRLVTLEPELVLAKQTPGTESSSIKQKEELIGQLRSRLDMRLKDVGQDFDKAMSEQLAKARQVRVREGRVETQTAIERIRAQENRLRQILAEQDDQARQVGLTSLDIQDLQFQMNLDKEMYDTVCRRIREVEMEGKADPRITVHAQADVESIQDGR
jgi:uncharacterized protein involved in exopolysaccharide biosynthesis